MITLIDIEATGLLPHIMRENGHVHCIMAAELDDDLNITALKEWYDDDMETMGDWQYMGALDEFYFYHPQALAGHNIIEYDIPVLEYLYDYQNTAQVIDSLVISRKNWPDRPGGHSIDAWAKRLDPPRAKHEINDWSEFTPAVRDRCREDVLIEVEVLKKVLEEMNEGVAKCK